MLNSQGQQHSVRGDDRERMTSARQAAEALFTPKRQVAEVYGVADGVIERILRQA